MQNQFLTYLQNVALPHANEHVRSVLAGINQPVSRDRLRPILNVQSIEVSPQIGNLVMEWSRNQQLPTLHPTLVGAYQIIQECSQGPEDIHSFSTYLTNIIRRLHLFIIHLLRLEFEFSTARRQNDVERFTQELVANGYNQADVSQNIVRWSSTGSTLWKLCDALGGNGVLMLLPRDVSRTV